MAGAGSTGKRWLIAPTVGLAAFMEVLDISIATWALQHIAGSLAASLDEATWVLTSYLVANAIVLPMSGWLANAIGRRADNFLGCIAGFSATSLLCGLAPSLPLLIAARALQGITGGGLQPNSQAILADAFPPEKRGQAFAIYGISVVFAPAIGPTLGGWINRQLLVALGIPAERAGWRAAVAAGGTGDRRSARTRGRVEDALQARAPLRHHRLRLPGGRHVRAPGRARQGA